MPTRGHRRMHEEVPPPARLRFARRTHQLQPRRGAPGPHFRARCRGSSNGIAAATPTRSPVGLSAVCKRGRACRTTANGSAWTSAVSRTAIAAASSPACRRGHQTSAGCVERGEPVLPANASASISTRIDRAMPQQPNAAATSCSTASPGAAALARPQAPPLLAAAIQYQPAVCCAKIALLRFATLHSHARCSTTSSVTSVRRNSNDGAHQPRTTSSTFVSAPQIPPSSVIIRSQARRISGSKQEIASAT
jgi:hypothetical protein